MTIQVDERLLAASDWTLRKEPVFEDALTVYAAIARAIQLKYRTGPWFYFEPTSGSGDLVCRDGTVIEGSPPRALRVFAKAGLVVDCLFAEHHQPYYETLCEVLSRADYRGSGVRWEARCVDSTKLLAQEQRIQRRRGGYGLIYWDGLARDDYPADQVAAWLRRYRMHDVLGMASGTAPKRMGRERLDSLLQTAVSQAGTRQRYGYVSDTHHAWGWVFSLVTGWPRLATQLSAAGLRLHDFASERGQAILFELATTKAERQLSFPIMPDDGPLGCWYCGQPLPELPHRAYLDPCPHCGYVPD